MTALVVSAPRRGGVATRRALGRWTWRLFRREWRAQLLVITLIAVAVAAATASATLVHNAGQPADADFGSAAELLHLDRSEEHTSELQSHVNLVCRLLLEKKK